MNERTDDISGYIRDREPIANSYVMRCFSVTMIAFTAAFVLNLLHIFVVDQKLMMSAYVPSLMIYFVVLIVEKKMASANFLKKYLILFSIILVFTIMGVFLTYHVVLVSLLPFLYATLYSSKRMLNYAYILTVISTIVVVYGGYYLGLCDANMVLLTSGTYEMHFENDVFSLAQLNQNPEISLMLFFVIPRCLIYVAFLSVCSSIFRIISGSTERAKLTEQLEIAKTEAENASRAKSQFLARVSHEIRTPINAVIGMNEMILRESGEEQIRRYAVDVKDSSVMLLNLINELLDASKIESGKMELEIGRYEIGSLLNDVYNMTRVKADEKQLELEFMIDPKIPCAYLGDDKRIRQILLNLLSNAVKYTERGKVTLSVSCIVEEKKARIFYRVKDTGIGIREEDINRVYDEFERFDAVKNHHVEGTGLGMNITQQFLLLMGSQLQIKSEYGKGTEFSFELVQEIANEEHLGDFRQRILKAQTKQKETSKWKAPGAKILVVDDNRINLKVFKGLLKETDMCITEAESGQQCLNILEKESFDIVFLDHMMPGMDGIETFRRIREKRLCDTTPVIMLTANAIVGDKEKYMAEGFDDFLTKPIIPEQLEKMIRHHLSEGKISEADAILRLLEQKLPQLDQKTAIYSCGGTPEFYLELLSDFTNIPIKEELDAFLQKGDQKGYHVRIHGFKNSAYLVGAKELGDLALELERMSEKSLSKEINELQTDFYVQFDTICEKIMEAFAVE